MAQTLESGFVTTLAAKLAAADTTMTVAVAPTVTKGRLFLKSGSVKEWIKFTGVSGTTLTGLVRGLSKNADPSVAGTGLTWVAGTTITLVEMHDQMSDKQEGMPVKVYATTTARDADITSPSNGMSAYVTASGTFTDYIAGAWTNRPTAAVSDGLNASATVAGKLEIGTQTEVDNVTDTGSTGAIVAVIPSTLDSKVIKQSSLVKSGITGEVKMWTNATPPTNWLTCDGSSLLRAGTYAALFAVLGTTYGSADGTHFNIPDFRGRSPLGSGTSTATGATAHALGTTPTSGAGGEEKHTLITEELAAHTHTTAWIGDTGGGGGTNNIQGNSSGGLFGSVTNSSTGSGTAHNIMSPHTAINFIIRI